MINQLPPRAGMGSKALSLLCTSAAALMLATAAQAQTVTITSTVAATSLDDPGSYPTVENIGNFSFDVPAYYTLIGATISGGNGNSALTPTTAAGVYSVAGDTVFTCSLGDACTVSDAETAWSFSFTAGELADLVAGTSNVDQLENLVFNISQTDQGNINLDTTTLTLEFAVPEPGSLALLGASLAGMGLLARRKRA